VAPIFHRGKRFFRIAARARWRALLRYWSLLGFRMRFALLLVTAAIGVTGANLATARLSVVSHC
jgi:hypothetical protein